jgi:hypothetical protein
MMFDGKGMPEPKDDSGFELLTSSPGKRGGEVGFSYFVRIIFYICLKLPGVT